MVSTERQLNATFLALADPTRRAILARLASGDATVMELAEPFDMSQPARAVSTPSHSKRLPNGLRTIVQTGKRPFNVLMRYWRRCRRRRKLELAL